MKNYLIIAAISVWRLKTRVKC